MQGVIHWANFSVHYTIEISHIFEIKKIKNPAYAATVNSIE